MRAFEPSGRRQYARRPKNRPKLHSRNGVRVQKGCSKDQDSEEKAWNHKSKQQSEGQWTAAASFPKQPVLPKIHGALMDVDDTAEAPAEVFAFVAADDPKDIVVAITAQRAQSLRVQTEVIVWRVARQPAVFAGGTPARYRAAQQTFGILKTIREYFVHDF